MAKAGSEGLLSELYRNRIGEPRTAGEVRGYWVFLAGVSLATLGLVLFVPSTSPGGATGLTLREASVFVSAIGLAMLVVGPVRMLPLQPGATYATYAGGALCFLAAVWFLLVFPTDWNGQTGTQLVVVLYALGLAVVTLGGVVGPLVAGAPRQDLEERQRDTAAVDADLTAVHAERDRLAEELRELRAETAASDAAETDPTTRLADLRRSRARFELFEDAPDEWRWRLRHRDGTVVAESGEGYSHEHDAKRSTRRVRRNALGATTFVYEGDDAVPDADDGFDPVAGAQRRGTFELSADDDGEVRFALRDDDGYVIADGSEGYASRSDAERAIETVRATVGPADDRLLDPTGFEVYRGRADEWRWRLVHGDGTVLAESGEEYTRHDEAMRAAERLRDGVDDRECELYEVEGDEHRWRCESDTGQVLADSGEGYQSEDDAEAALERVRDEAPDARILDVGRATFEVYVDRGAVYRWRLRHRNGSVLLEGSQGNVSQSGAREDVESVKRIAPNADLAE